MFKAFDSAPASINFNEVYSALQTKVVDGQENPLAIIDTAKRLAPSDTGNMRDSIGFITRMDKNNKTKALIGLRGEWYNHYLGVMHEYGAPTNRIQSTTGRDTGILEARPFMRPALDQNAGKVTDGIINGVDKILAKLAKKNNLIYK
jgi:hypothetical protein